MARGTLISMVEHQQSRKPVGGKVLSVGENCIIRNIS